VLSQQPKGQLQTQVISLYTNQNNRQALVEENNSIQIFIIIIIYVSSQEPKGQLQTQHSLDTGNYIIYKTKLQASTRGRK
jgi:hypothetical protein